MRSDPIWVRVPVFDAAARLVPYHRDVVVPKAQLFCELAVFVVALDEVPKQPQRAKQEGQQGKGDWGAYQRDQRDGEHERSEHQDLVEALAWQRGVATKLIIKKGPLD